MTVLGARPQFIKATAFSKAASKLNKVEEIIIHIGQHYDQDIFNIFFEEMNIRRPKYLLKTGEKLMVQSDLSTGVYGYGDTSNQILNIMVQYEG